MILVHRGLLLLTVLAATRAALAQPSTAEEVPSREQRLLHLARLWGEVRYQHPAFAYQRVDWDSALVAAIPRVEAAMDKQAYAEAVQGMLSVLGDKATRVDLLQAPSKPAESPEAPKVREFRSWEGSNVLVLDLRALASPA